jgi:hypothetical protein
MKGSQESLTTAVVKDAANWSTPRAQEDQSSVEAFNKRADAILARRKPTGGRQKPGLTQEVQMYGQAAPASSSSLGSRQGLWLTPRANEPDSDPNFAARNADRGAHCHGTLSSQAKGEANWWTPQCQDSKHSGTNPSSNGDRMLLVNQVNWPTASVPNGGQTTSGRADKDTKKQVRPEHAVSQWATPRSAMASMHPEYGEHWNDNRGGESIATQVWREEQWGTPTARDHKSGRGNNEREYKELTPMVERQQSGKLNPRWVETLMGLPIGWTMPSCTSPQTIAPMSCDSSAMELSRPPQSELSEFSLAS